MAKEKYYGFSDSKSKAEVPTKEDIATSEIDSDEKIYSANYINKTIGKLSGLTTSVKTSIVAAINKVWDTLEERTNGKVRIYGNAEGGNIEITSKDGIKWEIDANANHLRIYSFGSSNKYVDYTFKYDRAGGVVATVEEVNKKMDKHTVVDNVTTTVAGTVLDGRVGKRLNDSVVKAQSTANTANSLANTLRDNLIIRSAAVGSAYGVGCSYQANAYFTTVTFSGTNVGDSLAAYTQRNFGTLPAGYRPAVKCQQPVSAIDGLFFTIDTNGVCSMRNEKNTTISFGKAAMHGVITFAH